MIPRNIFRKNFRDSCSFDNAHNIRIFKTSYYIPAEKTNFSKAVMYEPLILVELIITGNWDLQVIFFAQNKNTQMILKLSLSLSTLSAKSYGKCMLVYN